MNTHDQILLKKLGIIITELKYEQELIDVCTELDETVAEQPIPYTVRGEFTIDEERFRPMCHLIRLVDMICESKNPAVNEMFNHLITMLELTKEHKK